MDNNNYYNTNSNNTNVNNTNADGSTGNAAGGSTGGNTNPYFSREYNSPNPSYSSNESNNSYSTAGSSNTSYSSNMNNGYNPYMSQSSQVPPKAPKKNRKKSGFGATLGKAVAVALVFGLVAGGVFTGVTYTANKALGITASSSSSSSSSDSSKKKANEYDQSGSIAQTSTGDAKDLTDVSGLIDEVMPSIVSITNTSTVNYQDFWGRSESRQAESAGSGIIINQDDDYLYIATNNHVVADSESLKVKFSDDKVVAAEVQGTDASDDLAVVKVKISDIDSDTLSVIKVATVGDSDSLSVGEASIAIGNALGYGQSVTTGVISALGRTVTTQDETTGATITNSNLIQTDAAINPGNSGGALLNSKGEVIGINSVKYASTEVEGIGYAIAMNDAMPILESLIKNGEYVNTQAAYLGIQGGDVTEEMTAFNIPAGVYITAVIDGSGAQKAGLKEGDIITKCEDTEITSMSQLQSVLQGYKAGDKIKVTVARQAGQGYQEEQIEITLSSKSDIESQTSSDSQQKSDNSSDSKSDNSKAGNNKPGNDKSNNN